MRGSKIQTGKSGSDSTFGSGRSNIQSGSGFIQQEQQRKRGQDSGSNKLNSLSKDASNGLVRVPLGRWGDVYVLPNKAKRILGL